jgi:hypothetical protein
MSAPDPLDFFDPCPSRVAALTEAADLLELAAQLLDGNGCPIRARGVWHQAAEIRTHEIPAVREDAELDEPRPSRRHGSGDDFDDECPF